MASVAPVFRILHYWNYFDIVSNGCYPSPKTVNCYICLSTTTPYKCGTLPIINNLLNGRYAALKTQIF